MTTLKTPSLLSPRSSGTRSSGVRKTLAWITCALMCAAPLLSSAPVAAQTDTLWTEPVNLSTSGGASRPVIAISPNQGLHALWWDEIDGMRYSRGVFTSTAPVWSAPVLLPAIIGGFDKSITVRKVALPPHDVSFAFGENNVGHLLFKNADDQLLYAQVVNDKFSLPLVLARDVLASDSSLDVSGTLHLAYTVINTRTQPTGIYYSRRGPTPFVSAVSISPYFRTAKPGDVQLSVASDGQGTVLLAWFQAREEQSRFVRSIDGGKTWSEPQPVVERSDQMGLAARVSITRAPNGDFLLIWRDESAAGCGFTQRRSTDGGATWSAPERIFGALTLCPASWRFATSDKQLWLIGVPDRAGGADTAVTLAVWDGSIWNGPVPVDLSLKDTAGGRARELACVDVAMRDMLMAFIGCDVRRDVYAAVNTIPAAEFIPALKQPWTVPVRISAETGRVQNMVGVQGENGTPYAMWSVTDREGADRATSLYVSEGAQGTWPAGTIVASVNSVTSGSRIQPVGMDNPSMAVQGTRAHAVWRGGESGRVFYSRAFLREVQSREGWSQAAMLPSLSDVGGTPSIVADPRGEQLYVLYPVGFNEARGVYLSRSMNGGSSWLSPTLVFDASAAGWNGVQDAGIMMDARANVLHATWLRAATSDGAGKRAIFYSRSADSGETWTPAVQLAEGTVNAPHMAIASNGAVVMIWTSLRASAEDPKAPYELWSRYSPDRGQDWGDGERVEGYSRLSGDAALAASDAGQVFLGAMGQSDSAESQLLLSEWAGVAFAAPEPFPLRQPSALGNTLALVLQPQGVLHALMGMDVLQSDGTLKRELRVTAREIKLQPGQPIPTFTPMPATATPIVPTAAPEVSPTPLVMAISTVNPAQPTGNAGTLQLVYGMIAAIVAILVALVVFGVMRRR